MQSQFGGCGITGAMASKISDFIGQINFQKMLDSIKHRGPDQENIWKSEQVIFGHTRLSILDLSDSGMQPMVRDHLVITYNGEIYNYLEIKAELETLGYDFTSRTDTEIVIRAYQAWGTECVRKFNGMFSFCIFDRRNSTLFVARDQMGIKPFYYYQDDEVFLFASEVLALLESGYIPREPNLDVIRQQVLMISHYQRDLHPTLVKNIFSLLPGHYGLVRVGEKIRMYPYWRIDEFDFTQDPMKHVERLSELLESSVQYRLISDVPVASFLSGGIDSSLVNAIICRKTQRPFDSFTLQYNADLNNPQSAAEQDKLYSMKVAEHLGDKLNHQLISINTSDISLALIDSLIDLASFSDDIRHISTFNNYSAIKNSNYKVVINCQGADELMGGYVEIHPLIKRAHQGPISKFTLVNDIFSRFLMARETLFLDEFLSYKAEVHDLLSEFYFSLPGNDIKQAHRFLIETSLRRILRFEDFYSMKFGVECRLPFLDPNFVQWVFSIPFEHHLWRDRTVGKQLLRKVSESYLPLSVVNRCKQAFPAPDNSQVLKNQLKKLFLTHMDEINGSEVIRQIYKKFQVNSAVTQSLTLAELWQILVIWRWECLLKNV